MTIQIDRKHIREFISGAMDTLRGLLDNASTTYLLFLVVYLKRQTSASATDHLGSTTSAKVITAARSLFEDGSTTPCSERLLAAIKTIKTVFPDLSDILEILEIDVSKWSNSAQENMLRNILQQTSKIFASQNNDDQLLTSTFAFLSRRYTDGNGKSSALTIAPRSLIELLVNLLNPKEGDAIYDPACGTGAFLMCCAGYVSKNSEGVSSKLYGQEINVALARIARLNVRLGSSIEADVRTANPFREPAFIESKSRLKTFDVVLGNPPFSLRWDVESALHDRFDRFRRGTPPPARADYAYILHMMESLKQTTGRMGIVVSRGVLFRGGVEGDIRRKLIEEGRLDAVIGLPPKLFLNTAIPVAILIFKNDRRTSDDILFIDAENDFVPSKISNKLADPSKILNTYAHKKRIDFYSSLASYSDIANNKFDLSVNRYVLRETIETKIDIHDIRSQRQSIQSRLKNIDKELDGALRRVVDRIS